MPVKVLAVFFRAIRSFRKNRPYAPEVIHRILRQAAGGTSEQEHTLPDVLWNHESHMRFPTDMKLLWESIECDGRQLGFLLGYFRRDDVGLADFPVTDRDFAEPGDDSRVYTSWTTCMRLYA